MGAGGAIPLPHKPSALPAAESVRWKDKLLLAALQPVSPYSAAAFRIIFGILGLAAVLSSAARGWIADLYIEPVHHLTYYGFRWVQPGPGGAVHLHLDLLALASLGVALGNRYRLSVIAFFLLFTYVELIDRTTYLNHYYLVSLLTFIMIFLPLNRAWSLDSLRGRFGGSQDDAQGNPQGSAVGADGAIGPGLFLRGGCQA